MKGRKDKQEQTISVPFASSLLFSLFSIFSFNWEDYMIWQFSITIQ